MKSDLQLKIYLQPGAKKSEIVGKHSDAIKIKVQARPIDGEANKALIDFLSEMLSIPKAFISIKSGQKSRFKTVCIEGSDINSENKITQVLSLKK